jgi:hypothetical protein
MTKTFSNSTKAAIASSIEANPAFRAVLATLIESIPTALAESAVDVEAEVIEVALARLRESLDKVDTRKIAEAVLANDRLRGKIKVQIDDLGLGVSQRLKADLIEAMTTEVNLTRNLLTARREKKRAEMADHASKLSLDKQQKEMAWMKLQLAWMQFSKLTIALPTIAVSLLIGFAAAANYFPAIACEKGDLICGVRVRSGLYSTK